ncbi:MAG TPA: hypothetical protein VMM38_04525 [Aridibacter sp.]|nr:hypothetical protein [Aridibacter sp.]
MKPNPPKLAIAILVSLYFLTIAYNPLVDGLWNFLNLVDLPIHETGHLIFRLLGEFMMIGGGSLFQVVVPAVFVGYFVRQGQYFSASLVLFWVGQSILNVWVYADDAERMQLVLTSGMTGSEGSFHDWNYLLSETGLIGYHSVVSGLIRVAGTLTILGASALSIYLSFEPEEDSGKAL